MKKNGNISIFYASKKIEPILRTLGLQLPNGTRTDSINHRIDDTGSPVKKILKNQTETQQFKRWFGDWIKNPSKASKVVDKEGKPLIVYHGSPELNINIFNKHLSNYDKVSKGRANWFTTNKELSDYYGQKGKTYAVYLNMRNPLIIDGKGNVWNRIKTDILPRYKYLNGATMKMTSTDEHSTDDIAIFADKNGYDGVIIKNIFDGDLKTKSDIYAVFNANQIKSATDNIGTFDGTNDDIRFSIPSDIYEFNAYLEREWEKQPKRISDKNVVKLSDEETYNKVVRIIPDSEIATRISEQLKGTDIKIPVNTVTPSLKKELEKLGVDFTEPEKGAPKQTIASSHSGKLYSVEYFVAETASKLFKWGYEVSKRTATFIAKQMKNLYDALKKQYDKVPFDKWSKYIQTVTKPNLKGEDI